MVAWFATKVGYDDVWMMMNNEDSGEECEFYNTFSVHSHSLTKLVAVSRFVLLNTQLLIWRWKISQRTHLRTYKLTCHNKI